LDGVGPRGIPSGTVDLLLSPEAGFWLTALHPNTLIAGSPGTPDNPGDASATIKVPALPPTQIGTRFRHTYVVFRSSADPASMPVPLTLVR